MRVALYYTVLAVSLLTLACAVGTAISGNLSAAGDYAFMFLTGGGFLVLHESTASAEEEVLSRGMQTNDA
jgi:hypothetical protein